MYEIVIQICFVVAGMVTGCTDGYVTTSDPYLSQQELSPVYIYDAPKIVIKHYRTYNYPSIRITPRPRHRVRIHPRHHHHPKPKVVVKPKHKHYKKHKIIIKPKPHKRHKKSKIIIKSKKKRH